MSNKKTQPVPDACPACGTMRVLAEGILPMKIHKVGSAFVPGITHSDSELWALACPNCGYITFYAKEPQKLEP